MFFAEEENKKLSCGQQEESLIRQQAAPCAGRGGIGASAALGRICTKSPVSSCMSPESQEGAHSSLPLRAPRIDKKPFVPPTGHKGESAQRQGQTLQGYLTPGP